MSRSLVITNGTYEPIVIEIFNRITERYEARALEAHHKVTLDGIIPTCIAIMLESKRLKDGTISDDAKELLLPEKNSLPFIHVIRNRTLASGVACYFAKIPIAEMRKKLLAERCAQAKKVKHVHWADEEKSEE
jgi:hypothetical protein